MARGDYGFTLVELMIVVTIVGVLAVVAGTAYRRYMDSGRTTEAYTVLGEIRTREEAYRAEASTYLGLGADETIASAQPAVDSAVCMSGGKEPCYKAIPTTGNWVALGINAGKSQLQCGYTAVAGPANGGTLGDTGAQMIGATPSAMWWYAIAYCDNDGDPSVNATFATTFNSTVVVAKNEHR
jgi:prepilin-type N-terminal cleavage/methylation domain-containing protein